MRTSSLINKKNNQRKYKKKKDLFRYKKVYLKYKLEFDLLADNL